jgi:amino acid transporter
MAETAMASGSTTDKKKMTLMGAIFIGIGSMVGAGIFALFGQAGVIAGAAVWVSFFAGGVIALLQGYSFAKLGAKYPSAGGLIDWLVRGFGGGLFTGGTVVLGYFSVIIVTAMVAVSFGNYAVELFLGPEAPAIWVKIFAMGMVILLTFLNIIGTEAVTKAQTAVVTIVLIVLVGFALAMLVNLNPALLDPAGYPPTRQVLASVALTFFAYLGFGVISFSGGDIENPKKNMPRAMYISLGFTMALYVALAIGVFGTLTVEEVIANADTALAEAAKPIFGDAGYIMISIAALFATIGAMNSQLYASIGATFTMAKDGHLPPVFGKQRTRGRGGSLGLIISAVLIILMATLFDLSAIASLGSAIALVIYVLITIAHWKMANETGASKVMLGLALFATALAILLFSVYTLQTDPKTFVILVAAVILAWVVEAIWRGYSKRKLEVSEVAQ